MRRFYGASAGFHQGGESPGCQQGPLGRIRFSAGEDHLLDVVDQRAEMTVGAPGLEPYLNRDGFRSAADLRGERAVLAMAIQDVHGSCQTAAILQPE